MIKAIAGGKRAIDKLESACIKITDAASRFFGVPVFLDESVPVGVIEMRFVDGSTKRVRVTR